jgi:CMP-N,N'-diacetyllegionaminic acid synthase
VRSGSQRVISKNSRPFCRSNLIYYKLEQLKRIKELDGIVLNANDDEMLAIGHEMGVDIVRRDPYYASSSVLMSEVFVNKAQHMNTDVIVYVNVTNPLLQDDSLLEAIAFYKKRKEKYDSVNSAHAIKEFMWLDVKAIKDDPDNQLQRTMAFYSS